MMETRELALLRRHVTHIKSTITTPVYTAENLYMYTVREAYGRPFTLSRLQQ